MSFSEIALPLVERGIPVIPLRPKTKVAFISGWEDAATTDREQILRWDSLYPDANCGSVAIGKIGAYWYLEVDRPEVIQRIQSETGKKIPATFRVRSSPGRGHFYFRHSPSSLIMGNISQAYVKGGDWSARTDKMYVVSPGSLHPTSGGIYEIVSTAEITEAPQWLIDWLLAQKIESKISPIFEYRSSEKIPYGSHDVALTSIAGRLRQIGLEHDSIYNGLIEVCEKRCVNHGPDYRDMCEKIATSICRYPPGKDDTVLINGVPAGFTHQLIQPIQPIREVEIDREIRFPTYPTFPDWVMEDTSIYEGLVKPFCDVNSRYKEFMFMPAVVLMLNYLGTKVRIAYKDINPSIFMVSIGRKGMVIKSSSVEDAIKYFNYAGILDHSSPGVRNAEGKTLVWTAGSPEGLGIDMQRTNCKNAVLYYDELSMLTSKASIDSSSLISNLLLLYESGKFSNLIKSKKDSYSLDPGTYCASLIACCTDLNFKSLWGRMTGSTSGLNDRFFFLYQPEIFKEITPAIYVHTQDGAVKTRMMIDKAVAKGVYSIVDSSPLAAKMNGPDKLENRQEIRAEKFALYFAVDLGRDEIDEECIERGLALVDYERAVKRYIRPSEAVTKEAGIQNEVMDLMLRAKTGTIHLRDINKNIHPEKYGTTLWSQAFNGLIKSGQIALTGNGTKDDPKMVALLQAPEIGDDT